MSGMRGFRRRKIKQVAAIANAVEMQTGRCQPVEAGREDMNMKCSG